MTLGGHTESVSSIEWINDSRICSTSWDHSIRVWDIEAGGKIAQINGNVAFFSASYSPLNNLLLGSCADRHVRLYDIRVKRKITFITFFTSSLIYLINRGIFNCFEQIYISYKMGFFCQMEQNQRKYVCHWKLR